MVRYVGVAEFSSNVLLSTEVLGRVCQVQIGDFEVTLSLPRRPVIVDPDFPFLDSPELDETSPAGLFSELFGDQPDWSAWGYQPKAGVCYIRHVAISGLLPTSADDENVFAGSDLDRAFKAWNTIVLEWAETWTGEQLRGRVSVDNPAVKLVDLGARSKINSPLAVRITRPSSAYLSLQQVLEAFRYASVGERPPVERTIFTSALVASFDHDRRTAVINAASAAEVALSQAITDDLAAKGVAGDAAECIIKQANGIDGLFRLYRSLGRESRVSRGVLINQLAQVRNLAAHAGKVPSLEATAEAINISRRLIDDVRPLPANRVS